MENFIHLTEIPPIAEPARFSYEHKYKFIRVNKRHADLSCQASFPVNSYEHAVIDRIGKVLSILMSLIKNHDRVSNFFPSFL